MRRCHLKDCASANGQATGFGLLSQSTLSQSTLSFEVTLKHVSPRKLALGEGPAGEALTALWYLGKQKVTPQVIAQIRSRMAPEEYEVLKGASAVMPAWMAASIRNYEKQFA